MIGGSRFFKQLRRPKTNWHGCESVAPQTHPRGFAPNTLSDSFCLMTMPW
jgi:hypothetical protein